MSYLGSSSLTFQALRNANTSRLILFKNSKGKKAHSKADGSDWSDAQWLQALVGEVGEYANLRKKVDRGDFTMKEALPMLANELADVQIYLDILAFRLGIDLGKATQEKFNEVSNRIGAGVILENDEVKYF